MQQYFIIIIAIAMVAAGLATYNFYYAETVEERAGRAEKQGTGAGSEYIKLRNKASRARTIGAICGVVSLLLIMLALFSTIKNVR